MEDNKKYEMDKDIKNTHKKEDETVKVKSTGNCNIRSAPTTSSAVVATVSNGTVLTRVRKGVATANGYTWDKVILDNGTQGYIATNFLVKVDSTFGYEYNTVNDDFKVIIKVQ